MSNKKEESDVLQDILTRWRQYSKITNLGPIVRRYFVMNAFDGVLTALGLIMTNFLFQYIQGQIITQEYIITNGVSVTLAVGISGLIGAYLAESAEMRKADLDQRRVMMRPTDEDGDDDPLCDESEVNLQEKDYYSFAKLEENSESLEMMRGEKVDLDPKPINMDEERSKQYKDVELEESISEKAEKFAFIILSLADGASPVVGALIGLLPFFFAPPNEITYAISFSIVIIMLFFLGFFLAKICKERIWKYGMLMVMAGVFTGLVSTALQLIGVN